MITVCPTITAYDETMYRSQLELITTFAQRIHIDVMDGVFTETTSPSVHTMWWPSKVDVDMHLMYRDPMAVLEDIVAKRPRLTIVHHEAEHVSSFLHAMHEHRLRVGIALLADTPVEVLSHYINIVDHVLVFSGNLGHHGGHANLELLNKVHAIRAMNQHVEIGWDGGISLENIKQITDAGVNVCNVGGAIHHAESPQSAYENLTRLVQ
jgi:ribulose-phosphate 3-epimerase